MERRQPSTYTPQYFFKGFESLPAPARLPVFGRMMVALIKANVMDERPRKTAVGMRVLPGADTWSDAARLSSVGAGTCPSIVAARVAELRKAGEWADWAFGFEGRLVVTRADGTREDVCHGAQPFAKVLTSRRSWTPQLELQSFETTPPERKMRVICKMLDVLHEANVQWLRSGGKAPSLYDSGVVYKEEQLGKDEWQDIPETLARRSGDCFPVGTLLLRDDFQLVPIEKISVGDRIWGRDAWATVERKWFKGPLSVDAVLLNNGSTVTLTGDHHIYVARCLKHAPHADGYGCRCRVADRHIERIRLRELQPKDILIAPQRIPFGLDDSLDPDRALVEGYYAADGWAEPYRFAISGKDGAAKEEQKREVERICERFGIPTRWHRKYIAINDAEWAVRLFDMGRHAPEKHLLSLNLAEAQAAATLRGVMADSNRASGGNANGGFTFTTTSRMLAVQTRLLHKMFGLDCSWAYIENHGGLGTHPIYRLGVRARHGDDPGAKMLRVRSVERDVFEAPCWDIQTSDHYVYLPEHDVTVSNCEDVCSYRVSELRVSGENAGHQVEHRYNRADRIVLYHILVRRADGALEDPSCRLGMRGTCQPFLDAAQVKIKYAQEAAFKEQSGASGASGADAITAEAAVRAVLGVD